jgi:hypothetical protein
MTMTTDKSSADALTEAERLLLARVNDCTKPIDAADRNGILKLIDRLAASQSSQPAAAPIDRAEMVKSWGEISSPMYAKMTPWQFYEAGWTAACAAPTAPSPADERAAQGLLTIGRCMGIKAAVRYIDSAGLTTAIDHAAEIRKLADPERPRDCSRDPSSCPDNEGYGCWCSDQARAAASPAAAAVPHSALVEVIDSNIESLRNVATAADEKALAGLSKLLRKVCDTLSHARTAIAAPQPAQADTIQCQAHSGPDCTECGGTGIWPARADARAPWPMLEPLHLEAIVFAYNEGYSKAYDGRSFPNPFAESGSQAAAWVLGTRDGNEARVKSEQPPAQADAPAEAREPSKLLAEVWDSALEQAKTNPALLAKLRAAIGSATADAGEARLTDEQREAIEYAITWMDQNVSNRYAYTAAKELRALLNGADQS